MTDQYSSVAVVSASSSAGHVVLPRRRRQNQDCQMLLRRGVLPVFVGLAAQVDAQTEDSYSRSSRPSLSVDAVTSWTAGGKDVAVVSMVENVASCM